MNEVIILSTGSAYKTLLDIRQRLMLEGLSCQILDSPKNALNKVRQCFGLNNTVKKNSKINRCGNIKLQEDSLSALIDNRTIQLRKLEFELLRFFLSKRNRVVSRLDILESVWGPKCNPFTNTVDVHIASLRKRLKETQNISLKTIHGVGYKLEMHP